MRQHLIIDADDTLWENNIYFERAFDEFAAFLAHSTLTVDQVSDIFQEIERVNAKLHGYGSASFGRSLRECYERLAERDIRSNDLQTVLSFAARVLEHPIDVIDGVAETLGYLAERHELTLFTKGPAEEQQLKIDRSGLAGFFAHIAIVREKDASAYRQLADVRGMAPDRSWMIGNSPRSDVNPALEAGLNAVFVPHRRTWRLEKAHLREGPGTLLVLERFADLRVHF
jgi:putative hydrolase of the HAD superfamily